MITQATVQLPEDIILKVYELKNKTPNSSLRSNVNGWQSTQYTSLKHTGWAEPLMEQCLELLNLSHLSILHLWFNINPTGAYHNWHFHGGSEQVGVCYLQVPSNSGNIEFKKDEIIKSIQPYTGLLLGFPGGLDHRVLENKSADDRITMAFNLKKSKG